MVPRRGSLCPTISYRPIQPSDLETLLKIHNDIFPTISIECAEEFFENVVHGRDTVSWAAVDQSNTDGNMNEIIGFVIIRTVLAKESEIADLLSFEDSKPEATAIFILELAVVETYRNLGIGTLLIQEVIRYASGTPICCAVYLHVESNNDPAIRLYKKMAFKFMRCLECYYRSNEQDRDAYLFIYFVNNADLSKHCSDSLLQSSHGHPESTEGNPPQQ